MGKKSKPSAPPPPDYASLIPQQEASNMRQFETMLQAGRVNNTGPFGSQTWTKDANGQWTINQQLSPEQQAMYDQNTKIQMGRGDIAQGMMGNVAAQYGKPFNAADQFNPQSLSYDQNSRQNMSDAVYRMNTRYMDPQYAQDENRLNERLQAQGFNIQDAAYGDAMDKFSQGKERAYAQARDAAYQAGAGEATDELNRAKMTADYNNQNQMQDINFATQDRARALNELNSFQTGSQLQMPGGQAQYGTPNLQNVDRIGAANQNFQNQLGLYNSQMANNSNFMSGLMGMGGQLGAAWMGAGMPMPSDSRLKTDIKKVGETKEGRNLYTWRWKENGEADFGVIADENLDIASRGADGFLRVDYSQVH